VVQAANGMSLFLNSKEGMTRGDSIMVAYGILLLLLIRALKDDPSDVNQPWYADDAGTGGTFKGIQAYFKKLQEKVLGEDIFWSPQRASSLCVSTTRMRPRLPSKILALQSFPVPDTLEASWTKHPTNNSGYERKQRIGWPASSKELAMVAERYPQAAYAGLQQKSLQQEWQFLQHVTEELGDKFQDIKQALQQEFLTALFGDELTNGLPGQLACIPVKKAGLAILNPTLSMESNWTASTVICGHLIAAMTTAPSWRLGKQRPENDISRNLRKILL
jgi:hypothetical protein